MRIGGSFLNQINQHMFIWLTLLVIPYRHWRHRKCLASWCCGHRTLSPHGLLQQLFCQVHIYAFTNTHLLLIISLNSSLFFKPLFWPFIKTVKNGAQTTLFAALDPELEKVSGQYFSDCDYQEVAPAANDESMAKWLWAVSEKWTQCKRKASSS